MSFLGSALTAHKGLKALMPNGRNDDGTLKNVEYTLLGDSSHILDGSEGQNEIRAVYLTNTGLTRACMLRNCYIQDNEPSLEGYNGNFGIWENKKENKTYVSSNGAWIKTPVVKLGYSINSGGDFTFINPYQPVELLKRTDINELTSLSLASDNYTTLTLKASGQSYTAQKDGYYSVSKVAVGSRQNFAFVKENGQNYDKFCSGGETINVNCPASKGEKITVSYTASGVTNFLRFYELKGSE